MELSCKVQEYQWGKVGQASQVNKLDSVVKMPHAVIYLFKRHSFLSLFTTITSVTLAL